MPDRERAQVIPVGEGDILEGIDVRVPEVLETVTVEGVWLYSDGKPVVDEGHGCNACRAEVRGAGGV